MKKELDGLKEDLFREVLKGLGESNKYEGVY